MKHLRLFRGIGCTTLREVFSKPHPVLSLRAGLPVAGLGVSMPGTLFSFCPLKQPESPAPWRSQSSAWGPLRRSPVPAAEGAPRAGATSRCKGSCRGAPGFRGPSRKCGAVERAQCDPRDFCLLGLFFSELDTALWSFGVTGLWIDSAPAGSLRQAPPKSTPVHAVGSQGLPALMGSRWPVPAQGHSSARERGGWNPAA